MRIILVTIILVLLHFISSGQTNSFDRDYYYKFYNIKSDIQTHEYHINEKKAGFHIKPFMGLLWLYRNVVSEQLTSNCEFYPSCSGFSYQALNELGLIKGLFITADRLTRCNGRANKETPNYLYDNERAKIYDIPCFYRINK